MFEHQDLQMFGLELNQYEVVDHGSITQLQVGENWNKWEKGQ